MLRKLVKQLAQHNDKARSVYERLYPPNAREWAEALRKEGRVFHIGKDCSILPSAKIVDPDYTWIGDRVCLGSCTLICHDGSIEVLHQRYGMKLDRIGPIFIEDDVFVGEAALILGGSRIGEGSIVGAGSVVRQNIPRGSVVMGNPAKVVAKVEDLIRFWEAESMALPWAHLIA